MADNIAFSSNNLPSGKRSDEHNTRRPLNDSLNWLGGWSLILAAFVSGAAIGLGFARDEFWGGYNSWRRRLARLGHIAMAALGMMNVVYAAAPSRSLWAGTLLLAGGIAMPAVCFLSAWRKPLRNLFAIPVSLLVAAAGLILWFGRRQ